jgi:hypothetical protein
MLSIKERVGKMSVVEISGEGRVGDLVSVRWKGRVRGVAIV